MIFDVTNELASVKLPIRSKITSAMTWFDKKCYVIFQNKLTFKLILKLKQDPRVATTALAVNTKLVELVYDIANSLDLDPLFATLMTKISKESHNEQHTYQPEFSFLKIWKNGIWLLRNYYQWSINNEKQTTMLFVDILPTTINMLKLFLRFILIVLKSWLAAETANQGEQN